MLRIRAALAELASKSEETRLHAARQAGLEFQRAARELSHDAWTKFSGELQERISELVTSSAAHEQLGGLALIQELTPLECEDHASKLTNFANFVRLPFGASADGAVLQAAAHALGLLAQAGGSETVEPELRRALQRLKGASRLESAVLAVHALAVHAPTLMYVYVAEVLEHLWPALRHASPGVREGAACALRAALELIAARAGGGARALSSGGGGAGAARWYARVYEEAKAGLGSGLAEGVHGALLAAVELMGPAGPELEAEQASCLPPPTHNFLPPTPRRGHTSRRCTAAAMPPVRSSSSPDLARSRLHLPPSAAGERALRAGVGGGARAPQLVENAVHTVCGQRPICLPGPSEGSGRSHSPQSAARAARNLAVASGARLRPPQR
jgi:hypothetical protein